jgi:hypothetical protein
MLHFIKSEARIYSLTSMYMYGTQGTLRGYIRQFIRDVFVLIIRGK